jgi:hypothetical protein
MTDEELFAYLMTSDLHEDWSPEDLKSMIVFFRTKVREFEGRKTSLSLDIEKMKNQLEFKDRLVLKKEIERKAFEAKFDKLSERKLSFKERFSGKINKKK